MKGISKTQLDPCEEHTRGKLIIFRDVVAEEMFHRIRRLYFFLKSGVESYPVMGERQVEVSTMIEAMIFLF